MPWRARVCHLRCYSDNRGLAFMVEQQGFRVMDTVAGIPTAVTRIDWQQRSTDPG